MKNLNWIFSYIKGTLFPFFILLLPIIIVFKYNISYWWLCLLPLSGTIALILYLVINIPGNGND